MHEFKPFNLFLIYRKLHDHVLKANFFAIHKQVANFQVASNDWRPLNPILELFFKIMKMMKNCFSNIFSFRIFYHLFLIRPDISDQISDQISDRIFGPDLGPDIRDQIFRTGFSDSIFGPDISDRISGRIFWTGYFGPDFRTRFQTGFLTGFQTGLSCYHLVIVWLSSSCPAQCGPNFLFH